ncbi:MAG TPA: TIGR02444 family protein [Stellaceae bacterium]|nr:TIGR02444 family protein [Stellaceae bacterium]
MMQPMSPSPPLSAAEELWKFSLDFYAEPGVEAACLALQDQHGRDVNIMLYLCWLGLTARGRIDGAGLARAEEAMGPWRRAAIEPLRKARRDLNQAERQGVAALYEAAKAIELAAERMGQQQLAALAPPPMPKLADTAAADAAANLTLYLVEPAARQAAAPLFAALARDTAG